MYYFDLFLKNLRKSRNLTQEEFAKQIGLSLPAIKNIELGKTNIPQKRVLQNICTYTNRSETDIMQEILFGDSSNFPIFIRKYISNLFLNGYRITHLPDESNRYFVLSLRANQDRNIMVSYLDDQQDTVNQDFIIKTIFDFESSFVAKLHIVFDATNDKDTAIFNAFNIRLNKGKIAKKLLVLYDHKSNSIILEKK